MAYIKDFSDFCKAVPRNAGRAKQAMIFNHYLSRLVCLAKSELNWINLPLEIPEMILEENLLFNRTCVFFRDDVTGIYNALPAVCNSRINRYRQPSGVMAYGADGFNYSVDLRNKEGVLIYDNYNAQPLIADLMIFAQRMTDLLTTIDINLAQQRVPIIYKTTKQGKRNVEKALENQADGAVAVVADSTLTEDLADPLYHAVPYIAGDLQTQLEKIWAEALTFIGIVNVDEKAERLNSFEVGSQIEEVVSQLNTRLKPRREACQQINEIFGLGLDVIPASWVLARDRSDTLGKTPEEPETEAREPEVEEVTE